MNLSTFSVRRGVTFGALWLLVMLFGLYSLGRLRLDLFPDLEFPVIMMVTTYTGTSPEDMETLVAQPLERGVASVERVQEIDSRTEDGLAMVSVKFAWGTDMSQAETDVRRALDLVEDQLPDDASKPLVFIFSAEMRPVVFMSLEGPIPLDELRRIGEDVVQPQLERVEGIASATVMGGLRRQIHVELDPARVHATGLDVNAIVGAVYRENRQEPGGFIEQGSSSFSVHTGGRYSAVSDLANVVVGQQTITDPLGRPTGAEPIKLGDVATLKDTYQEANYFQEVDGLPAVRVVLRRQSGENTVQAIERVLETLPSIQDNLPDGVRLNILMEDSGQIKRSLSNLANTALAGVGIAFLVLLAFLRDVRAAAIVATAIPLSVVATFAIMDQTGMSLNILSMAGLALAVGLLVDNAVVVLENIFRLREEGKSAWVAAALGAREVGTAVTAATLTTLTVFVPVLFIEGFAGMIFRDMAVTICFALAVSLLVAISFVPLAGSRLLARSDSEVRGQWFVPWSRRYGRALDHALGHRWVVVGLTVGALLLAALLATTIRSDLMAAQDNSWVTIEATIPPGTSLEETWARTAEVADVALDQLRPGELDHAMVDAGTGEGIQAIFSGGATTGTVSLILVPPGERARSQSEIEGGIRDALANLPGVDVQVGQQMTLTGEAEISVELRGHDLEVARALGEDLRDRILRLPDVAEADFSLSDQQPQLQVSFDRELMATMGLSTANVGQAIATAFQGRIAGFYSEGGNEYEILVRWDRQDRQDIDALRLMPVVTPSGAVVPLESFAKVDIGLGPVAITRTNQERVNSVDLTLADRYTGEDGRVHRKDLAATIGRIEAILAGTAMPDGFTWNIGGGAEDFLDSFRALGIALMISVLLVYLVMASQFESLRQPFIIIVAVPMSLIGVVITLVVTRTALDISSLIGVIMLVGIAVNNGIVMVDAANGFRRRGLDRRDAIAAAARQRLRPVLLTSFTTILAMSPLALGFGEGAEQWSGMARAVIGGLIAATSLTLFVVPVLYTWIARATMRSEERDLEEAMSHLDREERRA